MAKGARPNMAVTHIVHAFVMASIKIISTMLRRVHLSCAQATALVIPRRVWSGSAIWKPQIKEFEVGMLFLPYYGSGRRRRNPVCPPFA